MEAWKLGGMEAWGMEAWRLEAGGGAGGRKAWKKDLECIVRKPFVFIAF